MDVLFAPWRMKYINYAKIEKPQKCFICEAAESSDLKSNLVVYRSESVIVLMNKFPYNTGHLLIAPVRHVADLGELRDDELCELARTLRMAVSWLKRALSPDGFNVGINLGKVAGAGLESHIHIHLVPRWSGDTNFMPVVADTKVIPEALEDTYEKIISAKNSSSA
ncbi:MAG: HIT domain-containing protein [Thermofilum sp.]|uniref:HIT domain-containing protein n=1 Tax=Thermofilum pendens TaxID=2269 RepID=A0A7C4H4B7_THEPE